MAMTWQELADFINNVMPKEERSEKAVVWDASFNNNASGHFVFIEDISEYDADNDSGKDYSCTINTEDWF